MPNNEVYPWQDDTWKALIKAVSHDRLAHAILMKGQKGLGKNTFAKQLAQSLFCSSTDSEGFACGQCEDCLLFLSGNHPDFILLTPEEKSKSIKIAQVRGIVNFAHQTPQRNKSKVIIVTPAEVMNSAAANALLKTLEEPAKNTYIFLISESSARLLPTIRSRCYQLNFDVPDQSIAMQWLEGKGGQVKLEIALGLARGAPLEALAIVEEGSLESRGQCFNVWYNWQQRKNNMADIIKTWSEASMLFVIDQYISWMLDVIKIKQSISTGLINQDFATQLNQIATKVNLNKIYDYYAELLKFRLWLQLPQVNLNEKMQLESLLIDWIQVVK